MKEVLLDCSEDIARGGDQSDWCEPIIMTNYESGVNSYKVMYNDVMYIVLSLSIKAGVHLQITRVSIAGLPKRTYTNAFENYYHVKSVLVPHNKAGIKIFGVSRH